MGLQWDEVADDGAGAGAVRGLLLRVGVAQRVGRLDPHPLPLPGKRPWRRRRRMSPQPPTPPCSVRATRVGAA